MRHEDVGLARRSRQNRHELGGRHRRSLDVFILRFAKRFVRISGGAVWGMRHEDAVWHGAVVTIGTASRRHRRS
jgi:hypothetical protein